MALILHVPILVVSNLWPLITFKNIFAFSNNSLISLRAESVNLLHPEGSARLKICDIVGFLPQGPLLLPTVVFVLFCFCFKKAHSQHKYTKSDLTSNNLLLIFIIYHENTSNLSVSQTRDCLTHFSHWSGPPVSSTISPGTNIRESRSLLLFTTFMECFLLKHHQSSQVTQPKN